MVTGSQTQLERSNGKFFEDVCEMLFWLSSMLPVTN